MTSTIADTGVFVSLCPRGEAACRRAPGAHEARGGNRIPTVPSHRDVGDVTAAQRSPAADAVVVGAGRRPLHGRFSPFSEDMFPSTATDADSGITEPLSPKEIRG